MKVLVTGSSGFIGKNLISRLKTIKDLEIMSYDKDNEFSEIEDNINSIDFIFHLAGINRPQKVTEFYQGNSDLTKQLVDCLIKNKCKAPLIMSSSIQAKLDNDYGKSKKIAEDAVLEYGNQGKAYVYRLANVFGKWCRPNYNSVIATFCNNIVNDLPIRVDDENKELNLVYIDDIVESFVGIINGIEPVKDGDYCTVNPIYKESLGYIVELLKSFKHDMESLDLPRTGDEFIKKLFATYVSYYDITKIGYKPKMNVDQRGNFVELMHTDDFGQVSSSIVLPGITRGNHYHHTKMEKFIVVKGKAKINFRRIDETKITSYEVNGDSITIVTIPPGYTHNIQNVGEEDVVYILWCNEKFDPQHPDTYYEEV